MTSLRYNDFNNIHNSLMEAAINGEAIQIESQYGTFQFVPAKHKIDLDSIIREGKREIAQIELGLLPEVSAKDFLQRTAKRF